ncbi:hypothetical protein MAPG_02323 [Magnaporthiopsis poae ATCC 64411]|uniref:2-dehydropantoate 2-reductase n=1 Tax=Magnaporthiopsis poae (strain ATCC 64411 / 73-15) TaxID=644358 RepID=A0A0C4DR23_MAGP6|nr:hypothetical protein MAPG_02323 [Magnaporthiopsis poae ATCC 64411]
MCAQSLRRRKCRLQPSLGPQPDRRDATQKSGSCNAGDVAATTLSRIPGGRAAPRLFARLQPRLSRWSSNSALVDRAASQPQHAFPSRPFLTGESLLPPLPSFHLPFSVPSLLMPTLPSGAQNMRHLPLIKPTNPPISRGSDPSRPATWEDSLIRAVQVAAGPEVPPNYDFPFGIPDLLIQTSYDPLWAYHNRQPRISASRPAEHEGIGRGDTGAAPSSLETNPSPAQEQAPAVLERSKEQHLAGDRKNLKEPIHVLCTNVRASYIAFALSSVSNRAPPGLILPHTQRKKYLEEGRRISVLRHGLWNESNNLQPEPYQSLVYDGADNHIDHLVLTTQACRTGRWLATLMPRIDSRTVLCLIQDGLGVPEHLNATIFRDPRKRPRYVLGHMTHLLRHIRKPQDSRDHFRFALGEEEESGVLHLASYTPRETGGDDFSSEASSAAGRRVGLNKVEQLLHEVSQVMLSLPELSHEHKFLDYVGSHRLRGDVLGQLRSTEGTTESEMRWLIRNSRPTNLDFLSGWFLHRAAEVGVDVPYLEMTIELVRGKTKVQRKRADNLIAFQGLPRAKLHFY